MVYFIEINCSIRIFCQWQLINCRSLPLHSSQDNENENNLEIHLNKIARIFHWLSLHFEFKNRRSGSSFHLKSLFFGDLHAFVFWISFIFYLKWTTLCGSGSNIIACDSCIQNARKMYYFLCEEIFCWASTFCVFRLCFSIACNFEKLPFTFNRHSFR